MNRSIDAAVVDAVRRGLDRLDAQLLMARVLARDRTWVIAHGDSDLGRQHASAFAQLTARRLVGEPLAYLCGEKEFHGIVLEVDPSVLVPRPDTELLVDWGLELLAGPLAARPTPSALDLGTGSGAVALALKHRAPSVVMSAVDLSPQALRVARRNAERLRLDVRFDEGSWWKPVDDRRFDLVLANPPYVASIDPHLAGLAHEPIAALASGTDGLDALRAIVSEAPEHLAPGGWIVVEHGFDQAEAVRTLFHRAGLTGVSTRHDTGGHERCTGGCAA